MPDDILAVAQEAMKGVRWYCEWILCHAKFKTCQNSEQPGNSVINPGSKRPH